MSTMRDAPVLKAVAEVVKDHVGKAFHALRGRLDAIEETIKALPKPERGEKGDTGSPGIRGDVGPAGQDGSNGKDGSNGAPGKDAAPVDVESVIKSVVARIPVPKDGKDGEPGKDGLSIKGEAGLDGKDAPPVDEDVIAAKVLSKIAVPTNGKDGKDAPPVDTKAISEEILGTVLKQIPAPIHGKDGRDGKDAEQLDVNDIVSKILGHIPPPIPGKDVDPESVRLLIAGEVTKAVAALPKPAAGRDGRDGRAGEQGEAGKDALEMDIINGIDETASYQRGIFAKHRNGLFRAYRTTDPVIDKDYEAAGWMCVVAGVVDVVEAPDQDQRTVIRSHELSDGSLITTKYKTPSLIYRGVFKEGQRYEVGDAVTNAGAMWMCGAATLDKPGISKDWTLAVKRGSDGKDLRPKDDDYAPNGKGSVYLGAKR